MNADQAPSRSKEFTSWKFDLIDAMLRDSELNCADCCIAIAVLQRVNQFTRMAAITDHQLQHYIPRDRKAFQIARKRLVKLGWWEVRTGGWRRATEYRFLDERAKTLENDRLDAQIVAHEMESDSEVKTSRKRQRIKTNSLRNKTPHSEKRSPHKALEDTTLYCGQQWGESTPHSGEKTHLLHLQTPRDSLPVKGKATREYDAHLHACDRWAAFEETAARLEYDELLPRHDAERRARMLCGFGEGDADGWWSAATAPPTPAQPNPDEGTSDDQN